MVMPAGKRGEVTAWKKMKVRSSAQREIITAAAAFLSPSRALLLAAQISNFIDGALPKCQAACEARGTQRRLGKFLPTGNSQSCESNRPAHQPLQFSN